MRPLGMLWALLTILIAIAAGIGAYQWGLHDGLAQQIQHLPANEVPVPGYGYPYPYGPHWGYGFFPAFPLFGFLFFLLILFLIFRPRRWHGGRWGYGPGGHFEEMHRRAHEGQPPTDHEPKQ